MKKSTFRWFHLAAAFGLSALVLTGMRCNGFTPAEQPAPFQVPTYTTKRVIDRVDWPASSSIDRSALAMMKSEQQEKISLSGVPVLVPNDPKFLATAVMLHPNEVAYGFGSLEPIDGIDFTVEGSRVSTQSDAPVPEYLSDPNRPQDERIVVGNRKIKIGRITGDGEAKGSPWTADWQENGEVAYSVVLICVDIADTRCADETYLKSFVASLVYVGGNEK